MGARNHLSIMVWDRFFQLKKIEDITAGEIYDENGNKNGFCSNQVDNYKQNHIQVLLIKK